MKAILAASAALWLAAPAVAAPVRKIKGEPAPVVPKAAPAPPLYQRSTETIAFVWPPEGLELSAAGEFVLGSVAVATAPFTINGQKVVPHKDGGFLAWLPVSPGSFTFRAELALSSDSVAVATRGIVVPLPAAPLTGKPAIDPASLSPRSDLDLRPGDWVVARMKATPGLPARFRVGKGPWTPMREVNPALGIYEGTLAIGPSDSFAGAVVEYEAGKGWGAASAKGTAKVSASPATGLVATMKGNAAGFVSLKTGPANGFLAFPLPGSRLAVTGREGGVLRVQLAPGLEGWVDAKDVELAPGPPPRAVTGTIGVTKTPSGAALKIGLSERIAFDAEVSPAQDALTLRLFGAVGHTNWVVNEAPDFVREVRWRQEATGVVAVTVVLQPGKPLWGWWPSQENGALRLDLRGLPDIDPAAPLRGIKIMLDPGHMPSATGSTGPLGTKEMDANYAIALAAKARLEKAGAVVLMTRKDWADEVGLVDRPKQAVERGADLFVSLHNNALPDGENPFGKPRGFTVFYYHPHSRELGRAVHEAYRERVRLGDEGLRWGNLLVARLPAMPAILVENAYMIFPEQEALLNDAGFRETLARSLETGLARFLARSRAAARRAP